jgi:hypothetical protein
MRSLRKVFSDLFGTTEDFEQHGITPDVIAQLSESCRKSPDLGELEQYEFQLLFAADRTQRGCSEYSMIEESVYTGYYGYTLDKFCYYRLRDGLPIPMRATSDLRLPRFPPPLKVRGEIHAVRPHQFRELDNLKDNGVQFQRQRVDLLIPHRPVYKIPERYSNGKPIPLMTDQYSLGVERVVPIKAWMYIGVPDYWDELMDAGYNSSSFFTTVENYKDDRVWLQEYYSMKRETFF